MNKNNHISENHETPLHPLPSHIAPPLHKLRKPHRTNFIIALIAAALIIYVLLLTSGSVISPPPTTSLLPGTTASPIKHVIIIFQENHAFDNYFGTYPGAVGIPPNACIPYNPGKPSQGCAHPSLTTSASQHDMAHSWEGSHIAYDNGSMDGFIYAARTVNSISYYDNQTIPNYWSYAKNYVLLDNLFSSALSYSLPNHWYEVSGQAPNLSFHYGICNIPGAENNLVCFRVNKTNTPLGYTYLNESNQIGTIAEELQAKNVSWKYYSAGVANNNEQFALTYPAAIQNGQVFNYWNPLLAQNITYTQQYVSHIAYTYQIIRDINNGTLPSVSWVSPPAKLSEHPPFNVTWGMYYVTYLVNTVMQSKYWNNTAIIIMWDDYGGYYDNVAPPQIDSYGLSFRVPGIIISPYAKQGYIDNTVYDFESTMKFIEWDFGLQNLTARDYYANNLLNDFNFNQQPTAPYIIPLTQNQAGLVNQYLTTLQPAFAQWDPGANRTVVYLNNETYNASDFET